ncbi:MAG: hypothetical protein HYW02_07815 [Deltaproteobacteria bacterium]|nr:hypothetical protein [Deltaproteobacteria bacterium]MBI2501342.1 hypothetical protein [Deltaproteobacteria bacterium]
MRTTITLNDDVSRKIIKKIKESEKTAKVVFNELLRSALTEKKREKGKRRSFQLVTFAGKAGLMPGFSWGMSTSQILDHLDEEEFKKGS